MEAMRVDRACSGELCSSSRTSMSSGPIRRLHSLPNDRSRVPLGVLHRRDSFSAAAALALSDLEAPVEAEAELLPRHLHSDVFSQEYSAKVANLQHLEKVKGDLRTAMQDLDEPDTEDGFSVDDWHKLNAARQRYTHEQAELDREQAAERERRKQDRALKRAARKAMAEAKAVATAAATSSPSTAADSPPPARLAGRRAESMPAPYTGARANARSRSRSNSQWGRPAVAAESVEPSRGVAKGKGGTRLFDPTNSISGHDLLTHAEEVALSKQVQDYIILEQAYQKMEEELGHKPSFKQWAKRFNQDEQTFTKRLETGYNARTRMLICNQRLVVSIARKYSGKGMEIMDLVQEGMVGLLRGVEKFDHSKGFKFSTYATWWIRQSITRSITELSRLIRLPAHLSELIGKIVRAEREFNSAHGRVPTQEEVAKILDVPVSRIKMVKQASTNPKSIHDTLKSGAEAGETEVGEVIEDTTMDDMDSHMIENSMHRDVNAVLNTLSPREHGIIRMRYGLDDGQPKTLEEIGVAFHVTRERIRQIENKALSNLKCPSRNSTLNTYVDGEAQSLLSTPGWKTGVQRDSSQ